jgi:hypothetical protein
MLSSIEMCETVPLASYILAVDVSAGVEKWSWAELRKNYSHIPQYPSIVWKHDPKSILAVELFRWSLVLCAFNVFAFFGLSQEAWDHYHHLYRWLARHVHSFISSDTFIASSRGYVVQRAAFEYLGLYLFSTSVPPHGKKGAPGDLVFMARPATRRVSATSFSPSESTASGSVATLADGSQDQPGQLRMASSTSDLASGSPQPADSDRTSSPIESTCPVSADAADTV